MDFTRFVSDVLEVWNRHLKAVERKFVCVTSTPPSVRVFYPTHVLFTKTTEHYILELAGFSSVRRDLRSKIRRCDSVNRYFNLFTEDEFRQEPMMRLLGKNSQISGLVFATRAAIDLSSDRFPILKGSQPNLVGANNPTQLIEFGPDAERNFFSECVFASEFRQNIRCKYIIYATFFTRKNLRSGDVERCMDDHRKKVFELHDRRLLGVTIPSSENADLLVMTQILGLALSEGVHETTIGDFLNSHPNTIKRAFNTQRYFYEPNFKWIECTKGLVDGSINPDLIVQREDGYFDIVDLKLAGLNRRKITKGQRRRRRFIDYVQEGLAQLANYEEYFKYDKNREYAWGKYSVRVKNPRLILVVGNDENADPTEIEEAMRMFGGRRFTLVTYDTLVACLANQQA